MCNYVYMITCASDNIGMARFLFKHPCNISKKDILVFKGKERQMVFTAKNKLKQKLSIG